jgi:hypothetical protein
MDGRKVVQRMRDAARVVCATDDGTDNADEGTDNADDGTDNADDGTDNADRGY